MKTITLASALIGLFALGAPAAFALAGAPTDAQIAAIVVTANTVVIDAG